MKPKQKFTVAGGLATGTTDADSRPVNFRVLQNAYPSKLLGAVIRRNGSTTQDINTGLGTPLGMGAFIEGAATSLLPFTRTLLANFGGSTFYKLASGSWSSVTVDGNASFGSSRQTSFAMLGSNLYIAGGRPARWDGTNDIERVGIPAPSTAPSVASSSTGITGTFQYAYTFYDSTDNRESDLSPVAEITVSNKEVNLTSLETSVAATGVDKKRIYRTISNSGSFRLVAEITLATTTYDDTTADSDLGVTYGGTNHDGTTGRFGLPPANSYINAAYKNRIWWVDAAEPVKVVRSLPYIGDDIEAEYCDSDNVSYADKPITALFPTPARLLCFHANAIGFFTGDAEPFRYQTLYQGEGTVFPQSIASDGKRIVFVGQSGIMTLDGEGVRRISQDIDRELMQILSTEYNASLYVSAAYSPYLRQFLFSFSASSTAGAPWEQAGIGSLVEWEDATSGATVQWEDSASPGSEVINRVKFWGWSPETGFWTEYRYGQIEDLNSDSAYATFLYHPVQSSDTLDPTQEKTYFGIFDGTDGHIIAAHSDDVTMDDSTAVVGKALTGRILSDLPGIKRVESFEFDSAEDDPSSNGSIQYLVDFADPEVRDFSADLKTLTQHGDLHKLEDSKGKYFHLYVENSDTEQGQVMLTGFTVNFRPIKARSMR